MRILRALAVEKTFRVPDKAGTYFLRPPNRLKNTRAFISDAGKTGTAGIIRYLDVFVQHANFHAKNF